MSTILFYNVPASGHVNPSLGMVSELVRRGDRVVYFLTEEYRTMIEATGAEFRPYRNLPADMLEGVDGNPFKLLLKLADACHTMLPGLLEEARSLEADGVVFDSMTPWGLLVARTLNLPHVASMSLFALSVQMMFKTGMIKTMLKQSLKNIGRMRQYQQKAALLKQTYNVKPLSFADMLNAPGQQTLVYTTRAFQPSADSFDTTYHFVGPQIAARPRDASFPYHKLETGAIYISLGTVNNERPDFYKSCIDAFSDSGRLVVLSVGSKIQPSDLGIIPEHFIVRQNVPQLEILQCADVFITHGGMNSVHEGLFFGVPLVVVPQTVEQAIVGKQVQELGAGAMLDMSQGQVVSPAQLRGTAEWVLRRPITRQRADELGHSFQQAGGAPAAADVVQHWVKRK